MTTKPDLLDVRVDRLGLTFPMLQVMAFHEKFGLPTAHSAETPQFKQVELRMALIVEEFKEVYEAWENNDLPALTQELADLIYVCLGMAITYGLPINYAFEEVHYCNMQKEGGGAREDGKILKPEGWEGPKIEEIVEHFKNA